MKCVILGPTDYNKIIKYGHVKNLNDYINEAGIYFSKFFNKVIIIPDMGLPLLVARKYKDLKQQGKVVGFIPDKTSGGKSLSKYYNICDEVMGINGGWFNLNTQLCRESDIIFCLGFSAGVFIELCSIKYNQKYLNLSTKMYIDRRCISEELPKEVAIDLNNLNYFDSFESLVLSK